MKKKTRNLIGKFLIWGAVVFDNIDDVTLVEGEWKQKIDDSLVGNKIKGDLFKRYV